MIDWYEQHMFSDIFTKFSGVFTKMVSNEVLPINGVSGVFFSRQIWISWLFLMLSNKRLSLKRFIFISHKLHNYYIVTVLSKLFVTVLLTVSLSSWLFIGVCKVGNYFASTTKIGLNETNILNCHFSIQMYPLIHQTKYLHVEN